MSATDRAVLWEKRGFLETDELAAAAAVVKAWVGKFNIAVVRAASHDNQRHVQEYVLASQNLKLTLAAVTRVAHLQSERAKDGKGVATLGEFYRDTLEANQCLYQALASMRSLDRYLDALGFGTLSPSQQHVVLTLIDDGTELPLIELIETAKLVAPDAAMEES